MSARFFHLYQNVYVCADVAFKGTFVYDISHMHKGIMKEKYRRLRRKVSVAADETKTQGSEEGLLKKRDID